MKKDRINKFEWYFVETHTYVYIIAKNVIESTKKIKLMSEHILGTNLDKHNVCWDSLNNVGYICE